MPSDALSPSEFRSPSGLRIVVLGYLVRGPIGGMAWHHLQYVLGLCKLGHDVLFLEDSDDYPSCYDPSTHQVSTDPSYGLSFAARAFERLGMPGQWGYFDYHTDTWHGPAADHAVAFCKDADLVINVSGVNPLRPWTAEIPTRLLLDTDPVFTQVRHVTDKQKREYAAGHNVFFSFGENISSAISEIPQDGFPWQATRQPIVLDAWPVTPPPDESRYTTVMQWDSYPALTFQGHHYGMKRESFEGYWDLPSRTPVTLELALGSRSAPRSELAAAGWYIVDPLRVTRDPWTYQAYVQQSRGEFSIAKQGYVIARSGWFSERSACYLASGRPVITQDTSFGHILPCGEGLFAFHDTDSAAAAIEQVESDYPIQSRAAREIAAEYFDSRKVLTSLIERAMSTSVSTRG